jgi:hypothetical protein
LVAVGAPGAHPDAGGSLGQVVGVAVAAAVVGCGVPAMLGAGLPVW